MLSTSKKQSSDYFLAKLVLVFFAITVATVALKVSISSGDVHKKMLAGRGIPTLSMAKR